MTRERPPAVNGGAKTLGHERGTTVAPAPDTGEARSWSHDRPQIALRVTGTGRRAAATDPGRRPSRWAGDMEDYELYLRALGRANSTIATRTEHIRWLERDTTIEDPWPLTTADLLRWLGSHDWGRETRRSARSSVRSFWKFGLITGRTTEDPTTSLPAPRPAVPAPHPTPERVYETALLHARPAPRLMLQLAAEAGCRRAEVAQVHARDVIETAGGWTLIVHGKGEKDRLVPISASLARELRTRSQGGYVFPGQHDGHVSARWVGIRISRLLPDGMSIHGLRHRFGSEAYRLSRDMLGVQKLLGHASPSTTQIYVLVPDDQLRAITDAMAASARTKAAGEAQG